MDCVRQLSPRVLWKHPGLKHETPGSIRRKLAALVTAIRERDESSVDRRAP
ncbi:MAG: hypothetical protein QOC81_1265 [Thermoanaerobaculia bacterium]|jgi:hypothetical protein|nr:hypothetical protein [Thermoanaerobaculia bacterium]